MSSNDSETVEPVQARDVVVWDLETDVVVVGMGAAGACAALGASEAGATVIVLEASGGPGGTSAQSGGLSYLGGRTPIQIACGFCDTPKDDSQFLIDARYPDPVAETVRCY